MKLQKIKGVAREMPVSEKNQTITEAQEERTQPDSVHLFCLIILYEAKTKEREKLTFQEKSHQIGLNRYVFSFLATH